MLIAVNTGNVELHATQEMLSVARNIGEFIGNNVTWDHVCIWDTWQPWRLLEVSVTVICERIGYL